MIYYGVTASAECGQVGSLIDSVTIPYIQTDLLAWWLDAPNTADVIVITPQTVDYAALYPNCSSRTAFNYDSVIYCPTTVAGQADPNCLNTQSSIYSSLRSLATHCYPQLIFPAQVQTMQPAWASCNKLSGLPQNGVFDPPRALTPRAAMVNTLANGPTSPMTALPASQPSNLVAAAPASKALNTMAPMTIPLSHLSPTSSADVQSGIPADGQSSAVDSSPAGSSHLPAQASTFALTFPNGQTLPAAVIDPTAILVGQSTIRAGDSAVQIAGHQVSIDPAASKIMIDGQEHTLPVAQNLASPLPTEAVAAGLTYALASTPLSRLVVGSVTLTPNGPAATLSGTHLSLGSDAFIVGSSTVAYAGHPELAPEPATTVDGHLVQAVPSSSGIVLVDGQRITMGGDTSSINASPIALHVNGDLVLGSSTIANFIPPSSAALYFTIGSETLTLSKGQLVAAGKTLAPGDPGLKIHGTSISLGSSALHIGAATIPVFVTTPETPNKIITAAGQLATLSSNGVNIAGTMITPYAPAITISGTPISLGGDGLVVGTSTIALSLPSMPPLNPVTMVAGQVLTLLPTGVIVAGTVISINAPAVTLAGLRISLGPSRLVIGTSTVALPLPALASFISVITTLGQTMTINSNGLVESGITVKIGDPPFTISGTRIAVESDGIVIGTSTLPYPLTEPSSTQALGNIVLSGLHGGSLSTGSNETIQNYTSSAHSPETFPGLADHLRLWYNGLIVGLVFFWLLVI